MSIKTAKKFAALPPSDHNPGGDDFATLLDEMLGTNSSFDGSMVRGRVISVEDGHAFIDVGLKSEGRVDLKQFGPETQVKAGDMVDLMVERFEDKDGTIILSRERARREEAWTQHEKALENKQKVTGIITGRVKGGYTVDLSGANAFLPNSQIDIRPIRDIGVLMRVPQPFVIMKMDRARGNIVVSRRAVMEESRAEQRNELISGLKEGQILEGVVKNTTDYGAFIDLGGVDGLLHVTDISWRRVTHPSDVLKMGDPVRVIVIKFNSETGRISLGMKQLEVDPWESVATKYVVGGKFTGRVTNITDYGAFVEMEPGVEGLVHVSEMSWRSKNAHPSKIVSSSQEVEVIVLDVDADKKRVSLGMKQVHGNPWELFAEQNPIDTIVEGTITGTTEFGMFVKLTDDVDGMVHMSDLVWDGEPEDALKTYTVGETVRAKVLNIEPDKERVGLGIKQLEADPAADAMAKTFKGAIVTCVVTAIQANGIEVKVHDVLTGFIRRAELSRDKMEQRPDRFAIGEKVDAKVIGIDRSARKITLTIKGRETDEDDSAIAEFGSSDSGASLGDILGAAIRRRNQTTAA